MPFWRAGPAWFACSRPTSRIWSGRRTSCSPPTGKPTSGLRKTPPPRRFSAPYALEKLPIEQDWLETSAREDLRRSIAELQAVLVGQIQAIHAEFERAFASYREIDDFVEEKTVVTANAKAA